MMSHGKKNEAGYTRSSMACEAIDRSYQNLLAKQSENSNEKCGYLFRGATQYSVFPNNIIVCSKSILDKAFHEISSNENSEPITVLDIGAGDFNFNRSNADLYNGKIVTYGIAANDIHRRKEARITDEYHVFANAEYLSTAFKNTQFDFMFSGKTYMHYVDPIGSVMEAYDRLKDGGVLIIDVFYVRGCEPHTASIIQYLKDQGYNVTAGSCHGEIKAFIIQKTKDKPSLIFPLQLAKIDNNRIVYKPTSGLLDYTKKIAEINAKHFELSKKTIMAQAITCFGTELINSCGNLTDLFVNPNFVKLPSNELKYLCILAVVANIVDYHTCENILRECLKIDKVYTNGQDTFSELYADIKKQDASTLPFLINNPRFHYEREKSIPALESAQQQIRVITLAAIEDIIRFERKTEIINQLEKMGLPYNANGMPMSFSSDSFRFDHIVNTYHSNPLMYIASDAVYSLAHSWNENQSERENTESLKVIIKSLIQSTRHIDSMEGKLKLLQYMYELIIREKDNIYTGDAFTIGYTNAQKFHIQELKKLFFDIITHDTQTKVEFYHLMHNDSSNLQTYHYENPACLINSNVNLLHKLFDHTTNTHLEVQKIIDEVDANIQPTLRKI